MVEISPPCPPNSNGDRVDRELARSDEETPEPKTPQKPRRCMSEKQLETLRKAREAKAANKLKHEPEPEQHVPRPAPLTLKTPRKVTKQNPKPETPRPITRVPAIQSLGVF